MINSGYCFNQEININDDRLNKIETCLEFSAPATTKTKNIKCVYFVNKTISS